MSKALTESYLRWLSSQIRLFTRNTSAQEAPSHNDLARLMFEKEFVWLIPNDDNRVVDGLDLRSEFLQHKRVPKKGPWPPDFGPVSFLEVLIGLSRRVAFTTNSEPKAWAWRLLENLELTKMTDPLSPRKAKQAEDILDACIWRTYRPDGQGGFFPLAWPDEDQTEVELWYQMAAYINELPTENE